MVPGDETLHHESAEIEIHSLADGKKRLRVCPKGPIYVSQSQIITTYPVGLIRDILDIKGPSYLCDEIARDQDDTYVRKSLELGLLAFFTKSDFSGKRILDFGCGSGASTMILARMFPDAKIVGVEMSSDLLSVARKRLEYYGYPNLQLLLSPSGTEIPPNCGRFDFVVLNAVVEHLLPHERKIILPLLWSLLKSNGVLFINETPHRYFPVEVHTTGLPLVNYLPGAIVLPLVRRLSQYVDATETWEQLLRRGIRGCTEREVASNLGKNAALLNPSQKGLRDRVDLWHSGLSPRFSLIKLVLKGILKVVYAATGSVVVPYITVAFRKRS
jgi:2-polyprenyl-3-methyl-5-hydroxy-6-metoxy-1,4-benzoquinol methylase